MIQKSSRALRSLLFLPLLGLLGCPPAADDDTCTSYDTTYICEGGGCACGDAGDGDVCVRPDDTTDDDPDSCDNVCRVCAE